MDSIYKANSSTEAEININPEQAAKIMRAGLKGTTTDFLEEVAESLIDKLIDKEPEVSSLITSLIYKKINALDINAAIRESINKIAEEEFKNNILGVVNQRVCIIESELCGINTKIRELDSYFDKVKYEHGQLVYTSYTWNGEDVKFTSTCTLKDIISRLDYLQVDLENLKYELENERQEKQD